LTGTGINPNYYYFFVINYAVTPPGGTTVNLAGNKQAPGPVPVIAPGLGPNGFVIGSDGSTYGFSDYVEYNVPSQPLGYGLYHIQHTPTTSNPQAYMAVSKGAPAQYVTPATAGGNTLQFTLYLSQLIQASTGENLAQANAQASQVRYLQINIISTNTLSQLPSAMKMTDGLGQGAPSTFLNLDLTTIVGGSISNSQHPLGVYEPSGDVVVYNGSGADPSLDLVDWSIQYVTQ
jgi:hypothetical protein